MPTAGGREPIHSRQRRAPALIQLVAVSQRRRRRIGLLRRGTDPSDRHPSAPVELVGLPVRRSDQPQHRHQHHHPQRQHQR